MVKWSSCIVEGLDVRLRTCKSEDTNLIKGEDHLKDHFSPISHVQAPWNYRSQSHFDCRSSISGNEGLNMIPVINLMCKWQYNCMLLLADQNTPVDSQQFHLTFPRQFIVHAGKCTNSTSECASGGSVTDGILWPASTQRSASWSWWDT